MEKNSFFDIPDYYTEVIFNIQSVYLLPLFTGDPIDYMRLLYSEDNQQFYNVRDELILRGIGFLPKYQNNYLLDLPYNIEHIIYKEFNTNAFKEINFSLIGAKNFIDRFEIESDQFFNGVPLEGVLNFTRGVSTLVLKDMFEKVGFSIVPVEEFVFPPYKINDIKINEISREHAYEQRISVFEKTEKENTKIDYLFDGIEFRTFREYCQVNNVEKFFQLSIDFVKDFEHEKYMRKDTAEKVFALYERINKRFFNMHVEVNKTINILANNSFKELIEGTEQDYLPFINEFYSTNSDKIYTNEFPFEKVKEMEKYIINYMNEHQSQREKDDFKELVSSIKERSAFAYIEKLTLLEIKKMIIPFIELKENTNMLVLECFNDIKYKDMLKSIYNHLGKIQPLSVVLDEIMIQFRSRDLVALDLRRTKTLQEVGDIMGVTRERIRQIQKKITKELPHYKKKLFMNLYIHYYSTEKNRLLSIDDFMNFYKVEEDIHKTLIRLYLEMEETITYAKTIDLYIETNEYMYVKEVLTELGLLSLETAIIDVTDIKEYFSPETVESYMQVVDLLLKAKGYKRVNMIYVYQKINIIKRINYLFEYKIKGPLEMDQEGYLYFKELMEETFNIPYKSNKRASTARVADGENVILVDRNTFSYHHKELITTGFLYKLEEILDKKFESHSYVDPRIFYAEYGRLMEQAQLISPAHLYSIIQNYLDEKYETAHGNTLYIYNINTEQLDAETILLNYLIKNGEEVNKEITLKDLKWKEYKLDQLLARITTVLLIKNGVLKTIESFSFQQEDLRLLKSEVENSMKNGYLFTLDLLFELGFNEQFEPMIIKYNLSDDTTLVAILKWLLPDLQGHSKLLYWKDNPVSKLEQVIADEYTDLLPREELGHFVEQKGYSTQTLDQISARIYEEKYFYHYTATQYINSDQLHFSDKVKESLATYLRNEMNQNYYMSVYNMIGFTNELVAVSEHQWTEWLVYQFAKYIGYKQVSFTNDYRYETLILVKGVLKINRFDQLILHIVKTEYKGRNHEEDLARFLEAKNILNNPRKLPNVIHESSLFEFDSFGFFNLRSCENVLT